MVNPGDIVYVAVSGGADSVALLFLLKELEQILSIEVRAVHVEHGIRGEESLSDAFFVEQLCKEKGVPLESHTVDAISYARDNGLGIEEAARILRYRVFEQYPLVALAHHMDDQAETILFHMIRGTGLKGLCGMEPVRISKGGKTKYIRPLLSVNRASIEDYLKENNQPYCMDSTNADTDYSRNRLRHIVMPELAEINSAAVKHISELSERLLEIETYLQSETQKAYEACMISAGVLSAEQLAMLSPAIQGRVVRCAIESVTDSLKDIEAMHIDAVLSLEHGKSISLPYGIKAKRDRDSIYLSTGGEADKSEFKCIEFTEKELESMKETGESRCVEHYELRVVSNQKNDTFFLKNPYTKCIDYDKIKSGFVMRSRVEGDWFYLNSDLLRKKVSREMIDEKLSEVKRAEVRLISLPESDHILAMLPVGNYQGRVACDAYITEQTEYILEIKERTED